jgi:mannose-6-phosphate isomerase-like protein (cupin superfamily)
MRRCREIAGLFASLLSLGACATAPRAEVDMHYKRIALSPAPVEQPLLTGPPQTAGMRSGRVVLQPGQHMHRHSTEGNEEMLLFLQGEAFVLLGMETVSVAAGQVLYIPPHTEHEVHNDGSGEVRYIYVVAPAAERP